jgi:uncharacterized protein YutE (UPF0331/DUF86 family)
MVKRDILRRKLEALSGNLEILKRLQRYSLEEFISDPERYGSAERFLQLSVEVLDDIGSHIIADDSLGEIDTYSDIPRLLHAHNFIDAKAREHWIKMIAFRNLLVHSYAKIDRSVVHTILNCDLKDLESLAQKFSTLL